MSGPDDVQWTGTLALGPWWLLYRGAFGPTAAHRHHASQVVASSTPVSVAFGEQAVVAHTIVIPADVPHRIVEGSTLATVMFIDGDVLRRATPTAGAASSPGARLELDPESMTYRDAVSAADAVLEDIGAGLTPRDAPSREIDASLRYLDDELTASVTYLAARIGLSANEFSRRFSREMGLPFRTYRKWRRVLLAIEALARGSNLTAAAHTAGFADSGHLSRTFRSMFGIAPSDLTATSRWLPPE